MKRRYRVRLKRGAEKALHAAPTEDQARLRDTLEELETNARPNGTKHIGDDLWRVRTGDWRVIYTIDDDAAEVMIWVIGRRGDVYRHLPR
jgi:mRNA interferase RelE/StbE